MTTTTLTPSGTWVPRRTNAPSWVNRIQRFVRTPKGSLAALFVPLLALAATVVGWQTALPHMLAAVAGACLVDVVIARVDRRQLGWPSSALLSGMIVGFVLGPTTPWAVTAAVGVLATISKHLFATRRWHVFNPAALALMVSVPLFATGQSWWGALPDLPWPFALVLLAGGVFIVDRINKVPLVLAFTGVYFGLLTLVGVADPTRVAEMFRPPFVQSALFLALFMLTDPPTSPARYTEQLGIGVVVAGVSCGAYLLGLGQSYLLIGLLVGNMALAYRRWSHERQTHRAGAGPGVVASSRRSQGAERFVA